MTGPGEVRSLRGTREPVTTTSSSSWRLSESASGSVSPSATPGTATENTRMKRSSRKFIASPEHPPRSSQRRKRQQQARERTRSCRAEGNLRANGRALSGSALELERPVQVANALAHVDEAHALRIAGATEHETDAVVGDGQANDCVGAHELDANLLRLRVLCSVAERFLRDAVESQRGSRRQLLDAGVGLAGDRNATRRTELFAIGGERFRQPRFFQQPRMKLMRQMPDVGSHPDHDLLHLINGRLRPRIARNLLRDGSQFEIHGSHLLDDAVV